jgi:hypothetical protein
MERKYKGHFIDHDPKCPYCLIDNKLEPIIRYSMNSGNKFAMAWTCEHCNHKVEVQFNKGGFYSLRKNRYYYICKKDGRKQARGVLSDGSQVG